MADSLEGLSGYELFSFYPDWITTPSQKREICVTDNIYDGTIHSLDFYRGPVKTIKFKLTDVDTRLYSILIFFSDMAGRAKKFWMADPFDLFTVNDIILDTEQRVRIEKLSNIYLHGKEVIYFELKNGDRITRAIDSYTQGSDYTEFVLHSTLPSFGVADVARCSLVYLGRFDQDNLDIDYDTDKVAHCDVSFIELLEEYE